MNLFNSPETADDELKELETKEKGLLVDRQLIQETGLAADRFPESLEEGEVAEQLLASEMQKLSMAEHEKVMFDVHGIAHVQDEDPDFTSEKLCDLEKWICKVRKKKAYDLAKYMNESYVTNRDFRLMFLRVDNFDAKLGAQRMVRHFEVKKRLFGDGEVLGREVRLADLSDEDMRALDSGFVQVLPSRDSADRTILSIKSIEKPEDVDFQNAMRALWYLFNVVSRDEENQKKGVIPISLNIGKLARREPLSHMKQFHYTRSGIPLKMAGIHYCYDDIILRPFVAGVRLLIDKKGRDRFRSHFGTPEKIEFELRTFGISTEDLPFGPNGELSVSFHQEWLRIRRALEDYRPGEPIVGVIVPRRFDVLFGRGRNTRQHTGNLRASHLVEMHQEEYEKAGKFGKTVMAERIVTMIHSSYGRFLKWENRGWVEVDNDTARDKISHFFRLLRSRSKAVATTATGSKTEENSVAKRVTPCPSPVYTLAEETQTSKMSRSS